MWRGSVVVIVFLLTTGHGEHRAEFFSILFILPENENPSPWLVLVTGSVHLRNFEASSNCPEQRDRNEHARHRSHQVNPEVFEVPGNDSRPE